MSESALHLVADAGDEARRRLAQEIQRCPRYPDLHLQLGLAHYTQGGLEEARLWFARALEIHPTYRDALSSMGHAFLRERRIDDAADRFEEAHAASPNTPWTWNDLGILWWQMRRTDDARRAFDTALQFATGHPLVLRNRALLEASAGDLRAAAAFCGRAVAASPELGETLRHAGAFDGGTVDADAMRTYALGIELNPAVGRYLEYLASTDITTGAFEHAHAALSAALLVHFDVDAVSALRGQVHAAQGDEEQALRTYDEGIRRAPDAVKTRIAAGFECARQGDVAQAIAHFEQVRSRQPGYADVHFNLGLLYYDTGNLDEAVESYLAALHINPEYAIARNALAFTLLKRGDLLLAEQEYRRTLAHGLSSADILVNMGRIHLENGDFTRALHLLEQATAVNPDYAPAYYHLGHAYQRLAMNRRARSAWRHFLRAAKESEHAVEEAAASSG